MADREAEHTTGVAGAGDPAGTGRRTVLVGGAVGVGLLGGLLAGCGSGGDGGSAASRPLPAKLKGKVLVKVSEVPVGGGKIDYDDKIVFTQPEKGTFKAFSAVCTHRGCTVSQVQDGLIICSCHGSEFSITDGSVKQGPAKRPLPEYKAVRKGTGLAAT